MRGRGISSTLWQRIEGLFHAARALPAPARQEFLADACEGDEVLYREVASLLAAHEEEGAFPEDAAARLAEELAQETGTTDAETVIEEAGESASSSSPRQIGPYKILRQLGEGGMGTVYLAQQSDPLPRRVALKLIRQGLMSVEILRRFERERRAMAKLSHPAIAQVFDAGTDRGQPYVVLEYIPGQPITGHCDERRLDLRQRLRLMLEVCEGVQYAHDNGVIHRDLKPSNLLVRQVGDRSLPKIIDFGIAKALEPRAQTVETASRLRLGSPGYMSPEALLEGATTTDEQTDVYSLGVILYQLLVGMRPFDRAPWLLGVDPAEVGDPPAPSQRLGSLAPERRHEVAAARGTQPRKLQRQLKGDLDWIVRRAVATSSAKRHASVAELAGDLECWLEGRSIQAWPVRMVQSARKLAPYAVLCLAVLLAGLMIFSFPGEDAGVEPERAESEIVVPAEAPRSRQITGNATGTLPVGVGEHWVEAEVQYFYGDYVAFDAQQGKGKGWIAAIIFTHDIEPEFGIIYGDETGEKGRLPVYAEEIVRIEKATGEPSEIWPDDVPHQISVLDNDRVYIRVLTEYALGEVMPFENEEGGGQGVVVGFEVDEYGIIYYQLLPEGAESILSVIQSDLSPGQLETSS